VTRIPPYIGDFSDEDIDWVTRVGFGRRVPAGERIIVEGERVDHLFIVLRGELLVSSRQLGLPNMKRLGPGEIVGEMSYVNNRLPISSVHAREDSVVFCIPRTALSEKIAADAGFQGRFHKVVSEFTVDRLYTWWASGAQEPVRDEASLRVYILIERMLRGEFPELASPQAPDRKVDDPPPKPPGKKRPPRPKPRKEDGQPPRPDRDDDEPPGSS
jgi:hypothetical protein